MSKDRDKKISIVLLIANVLLTFYFWGSIHGYPPHSHYSYYPDPMDEYTVVRLKSDAVAVNSLGDEVVYEAGDELWVTEFNDDGSLAIYDRGYGMEQVAIAIDQDEEDSNIASSDLTVLDPEYEDVTEEVHLRVQEKNDLIREAVRKEYREYLKSRYLWPVYPGAVDCIRAAVILTAVFAGVDILFLSLYSRFRKKGKMNYFIVLNVLALVSISVHLVLPLFGG